MCQETGITFAHIVPLEVIYEVTTDRGASNLDVMALRKAGVLATLD
jgi:hypothetical protein